MSDGEKKDILVAGETVTQYFFDSSTQTGTTKDAFLLALDKNSGNVNLVDVFALDKGANVDNGALFEGNLDLHMTQDHNAFMVGNTNLYDPNGASKPYLIERYQIRDDVCEDIRTVVGQRDLVLRQQDYQSTELDITQRKLKIKSAERRLENNVVCDKKIVSNVRACHSKREFCEGDQKSI